MYHFCTYFDQHYLPRGLALHHSLTQHVESFTLYVLCFDDFTYNFLNKLKQANLIPIALETFEHEDTALQVAKKNRSVIEYYFTCTPSLPIYVLNHFSDIDVITYLDADLFFFRSPTPIYKELDDNSILIIGHRFPTERQYEEALHGVYNVGFLSFRNDNFGRACLERWREQCIEWCYDREEDGKYADQKYLDDWPTYFEQVVVLQHKGGGVAPWNVSSYKISVLNDEIHIDSDPLIFYHFHSLKILRATLFDLGDIQGFVQQNLVLKNKIYAPYLRKLQIFIRQTNTKNLINIRKNTTGVSNRYLIGQLIYGKTLFVYGPITITVHLERVLRPLLIAVKLITKRFGWKWAKEPKAVTNCK